MPEPLDPWRTPLVCVRQVLQQAWERREWAVLAARRPAYQGAAAGVDKFATLSLLNGKSLSECQSVALRCVLAGEVVTERRA